jgi:predicted transglutaminase-like cysteine proteinase
VRLTIKAIAATAVMTVTATAVQQDSTAFAALSVQQPIAFTDLKSLGSDGYGWPTPINGYGSSPLLQLQLDRSESRPLDRTNEAAVPAEAPQLASLEQPQELASLPPSRGEDLLAVRGEDVAIAHGEDLAGNKAPAQLSEASLAPEQQASLAPSGRMDLPPARPMLTPIVRIQFSTPVLAPMAHTFFCLKYPSECMVHKVVFRGGAMSLTAKRWAELERVNAAVNRAIIPHPNRAGLAAEKWLIAPKAGECHDYAVTKRHDLIALGWPERDLLLSEVVTSWGEHHLVLVVRTSEGDLVADSLTGQIRDWSSAPYQWLRIQKPENPTFWSSVASTTVWVKATGLSRHES